MQHDGREQPTTRLKVTQKATGEGEPLLCVACVQDELRETSNGGNSCGGRNCITVDEAFTRVRVRSVYEEHEDLQSRRHVMSDVDVRDHRTRLRLRVSGQDGG